MKTLEIIALSVAALGVGLAIFYKPNTGGSFVNTQYPKGWSDSTTQRTATGGSGAKVWI